MKIEFAKQTDRAALKEVYHSCFPGDPDSFWNFQLDSCMESDNILVYRENGRIISTVQLLPYFLTLEGVLYPVQYIYAAATLPEEQGRGIMGQLLHYAHQLARVRGQRFSVLITQNDSLFDFYARFGYRDCGKTSWIYPEKGVAGIGFVRVAQPGDIEQMLALYQAEQKNTFSVARNQTQFAMQQAIYGSSVLVYEENGVISAYGFKTGDHMLEIVGPACQELLVESGVSFGITMPNQGSTMRRNGCVLPLDDAAETLLGKQDNIVYLNLMWN